MRLINKYNTKGGLIKKYQKNWSNNIRHTELVIWMNH